MSMSNTAENLYDEALKLDPEERSVLALKLLDSLGEPPEVIEHAWKEEIARRLQEIDAGRTTPVSWEQAKQRIFAPR
jgi:putative addiction module component (TIGR02574 family)